MIGSLSYADLWKVDIFHYMIKKTHLLISELISSEKKKNTTLNIGKLQFVTPDLICTKTPKVSPKIAFVASCKCQLMKSVNNVFWLYRCPEFQKFSWSEEHTLRTIVLFYGFRWMTFLYLWLVWSQFTFPIVRFKEDYLRQQIVTKIKTPNQVIDTMRTPRD